MSLSDDPNNQNKEMEVYKTSVKEVMASFAISLLTFFVKIYSSMLILNMAIASRISAIQNGFDLLSVLGISSVVLILIPEYFVYDQLSNDNNLLVKDNTNNTEFYFVKKISLNEKSMKKVFVCIINVLMIYFIKKFY